VKHTRHLCDFCGGTILAAEPHAKLTVPMTEEDKKLKRRVGGRKGYAETPESIAYRSWFSSILGDGDEPRTTAYDMCHRCTVGLLRARFATITAVREAYEGAPLTATTVDPREEA
jgi:hypothetical protein